MKNGLEDFLVGVHLQPSCEGSDGHRGSREAEAQRKRHHTEARHRAGWESEERWGCTATWKVLQSCRHGGWVSSSIPGSQRTGGIILPLGQQLALEHP